MPSFRTTEVRRSWPKDVGVLAMEIYFPYLYVDQAELEAFDKVSTGKYTIGLGQARMGFCSDREDVNSLCLTVTSRLLERTGVALDRIGRLEVGTETIIDKSKSVKTVLMQLFEESGNTDIEGVDTTNACYGGTAALFNAVAWVESSAWDGRYALVVAGDIAAYPVGPARPTGGAGAVAMLVGPNAALIFEPGVRASHMSHVYDFYKPEMRTEYAEMDGKLSVMCYCRALDKCYAGFCKKARLAYAKERGDRPVTLDDLDAMLFHAPYGKLVQKSLARVVLNDFLADPAKHPELSAFSSLKLEETINDREVERAFMQLSRKTFEQKTLPSLLLSNQVGNMYTPSLYSCVASYVASCPVAELAGRRVGMFSYGSGMAATMFSIRVTRDLSPESPLLKLHASLVDLPSRLAQRRKVTPEDFARMMELREKTHQLAPYSPVGPLDQLFPGTWYLDAKDEKHRRSYKRIPLLDSNGKAPATAVKEDVATNGQPVNAPASGAH